MPYRYPGDDYELLGGTESVDDGAEENPRPKRNKKGQFVKGSSKKKTSKKKGVVGRFVSRVKRAVGGKKTSKKKGAARATKAPKGLTARVTKLEGAVKALSHNDATTQRVLGGVVNVIRAGQGAKPLQQLPGYVRVSGYQTPVARRAAVKALPAGR
jgi:hypothetical protein